MKKHIEARAIRVDTNIIVNETNVSDPRIIAINLIIHGNRYQSDIRCQINQEIRNHISAESDNSENKKDSFYRLLNEACQKQGKK